MCLVSFSKTEQYSALKKLQNKTLPAWAYIVICDDCSHTCSWCYGEFNHDLSHRMSLDEYLIILTKLQAMDVFQITLAGGEPTEHPLFREFVAAARARGFLLHVATHGEHIDRDLADFLGTQGVDQVQFNWQGLRYHDQVHGVPGSYAKALAGARFVLEAGMEMTATITVGKYNLPYVKEIMSEAAQLGATRLRVWESTGFGNAWRKGMEAVDIFEHCRSMAAELGYTHCLSYDPVFVGDVHVPCIQFSNLYMYINAQGKLTFCGAVPSEKVLADFLDPAQTGPMIRAVYLEQNRALLGDDAPYCVAREGFDHQGVSTQPIKWIPKSTASTRL